MLLLEAFLVFAAQRHDVAHIDFVEGRQLGGGVLRFLQAQRDGLAQTAHGHALFARFVGARSGRQRRRARRALLGARFERGQHVAFGDAAVFAGCHDAGRIEPAFFRNTPYRGHHRRGGNGSNSNRWSRCGLLCGGWCGGCRFGRRFADHGFGIVGQDRRGFARFAFGDGAQNAADLNRVAGFDGDLFDGTVGGGGHFHRHLVGLQFQQRLVAMHRIAFFLEPARDGRFGNGFAHRRNFDLDAHEIASIHSGSPPPGGEAGERSGKAAKRSGWGELRHIPPTRSATRFDLPARGRWVHHNVKASSRKA